MKLPPLTIPPLGYCSRCLREGAWSPALTIHEGASTCATCLIHQAGPGPGITDGKPDDEAKRSAMDALYDRNPTGLELL